MKVKTRLLTLDRFPDGAHAGWDRLTRDVVGGGSASTALIAALDAPVAPLLEGVDVDAALAAADGALVDDALVQPPPRIDLLPYDLAAASRR